VLFNLTLPDKSQTRYEQLKNMILTGVKSGEGAFLYQPMETVYHSNNGVRRVTTQTIFPIKTQKGYQIGGISHDITERIKIEEELRRANAELTRWLSELEVRNKETMLLKEMGDLLHSCHEVEEAYQVFDQLIQQLFPDTSGVLYTFLNSENSLEAVTIWGDPEDGNQPIHKDDCWGLRRGQVHRVDDPRRGMLCPHVHLSGASSSLCVPLVAQSETIGMFHIHFWEVNRPEGVDQKSWMDSLESLAVTMADQVGMALANLKMHRLLNEQVNHDTLTGLFNRKYIEETLQREIHRVIRQNGQLGIMLLDLDHLTDINALFGQATGNEVLVTFADLLKNLKKPCEIPCRYGGDIFALLLPDSTIEETRQRAEEVRLATKNLAIDIMGKSVGPVTLSVGAAAFPDHGREGETILQSAESALTLAKAEGHDRVKVL
jgi:diguanylate cyclase (GGDEF)-like protein